VSLAAHSLGHGDRLCVHAARAFCYPRADGVPARAVALRRKAARRMARAARSRAALKDRTETSHQADPGDVSDSA
jgi:hypothetical protein